jgi:hypothetical protein
MCVHCGQRQLTQQCLTEYLILLWKRQKKNNLKQDHFSWSFCNLLRQPSLSICSVCIASPLTDCYTILLLPFWSSSWSSSSSWMFSFWFLIQNHLLTQIHPHHLIFVVSQYVLSLSYLSFKFYLFSISSSIAAALTSIQNTTTLIAAILQKCHWWCVITAVCYTGSLFYLTTTVYHCLSAAVSHSCSWLLTCVAQ